MKWNNEPFYLPAGTILTIDKRIDNFPCINDYANVLNMYDAKSQGFIITNISYQLSFKSADSNLCHDLDITTHENKNICYIVSIVNNMFTCRKSKNDYLFKDNIYGMYGNFTFTRYAISLKTGYDMRWSCYPASGVGIYFSRNILKQAMSIHYPVKTSDGIRNVLYTNNKDIYGNDRLAIGFPNVTNINQLPLLDLAKQSWSNIFHSNDPRLACRYYNEDIILNRDNSNEILVINGSNKVLTNV